MASSSIESCPPCERPASHWDFDPPLTCCPLCGSQRIHFHDRDYLGRQVDGCGRCGLRFMNPQYTDDYLARYYSGYYADLEVAGQLPSGNPEARSRQVAAKTARLQLLTRYVSPGKLLCVGCGDGLELRLAQRLGWRVEGLDIDPAYVDQLRGQLDVPLHCGHFPEVGLPAASYDAIFMDQVLEHPKRPAEYLREANRLLRPGGCLFLACPNLGSLANRWKTAVGRCRLKSRRGRHYDMFHHLFFYRPAALQRSLARDFGYEVLCVQGDPDGGRRDTSATWHAARRSLPLLESSFRLIARKPLRPQTGTE